MCHENDVNFDKERGGRYCIRSQSSVAIQCDTDNCIAWQYVLQINPIQRRSFQHTIDGIHARYKILQASCLTCMPLALREHLRLWATDPLGTFSRCKPA